MNTQTAQLKYIPASELVHASNIRQSSSPKEDSEMKVSILSQGGVHQNLIAAPRKSDGKLAVFAGGRRLTASLELIAEGQLDSDFELPVMVRADIDPESPEAIELALTENVIRAAMDYVDECNAMLMLSSAGRSDADIGAAFDYRPRTVRERLLIATLVPEAQDILRDKSRNLEWARALTIADKTMQKKICDDIVANENAWKTADDVRNYLTKATIDASSALFDLDDYDGIVIKDFFEGDKLADTEKFWELQHDAIQERVAELDTKGYGKGVTVLYEAFEDWRYEETDDLSEAHAFIEVMPNGAVREVVGVKSITADKADVASLPNDDEDDGGDTRNGGDISPLEVRPTPRVCEYAAAYRSAMLQNRMAGDFRACLEYTVLAYLGARSASISSHVLRLPGKDSSKVGEAFTQRQRTFSNIIDIAGNSSTHPDIDEREAMQLTLVSEMSDAELQNLFTLLVSVRVGQQKSNTTDSSETALSNIFGEGIDVRKYWTPSKEFFQLMSLEDLRRIATALLPGDNEFRFANSPAKGLIRALTAAFEDAKEGKLAADRTTLLNFWVPGVMSFPARVMTNDDMDEELFGQGDADIEASIFDVAEDEATAAA